MEPLFKWVGSKRWIASKLAPGIRRKLSGTYIEPFLGSAAVFFELDPYKAILCDSIQALVWTYKLIGQNPYEVWQWMKAAAGEADDKENFYYRRDRFNRLLLNGQYDTELAGLFIYLLKACFNGLWRQNEEGEFNVPYGDHPRLVLPSISDLILASQMISRESVELRYIENPASTLAVIDAAKSGDVIFSDPPYFDVYNEYDGMFAANRDFQELLAIALWNASIRGVSIYAMNIDCEDTRRWYSPFGELETFERSSVISGNDKGRRAWNQLLAISK